MSKPPLTPLFSTRAALVLLLGIVGGVIAGSLTYLAGNNVAAAVLAGLAATGMATAFFHNTIADDAGNRSKDNEVP